MDRQLRKLAKQLNTFDEASLMGMWNNYAQRVQTFEPTQEWEEDVLVFCLLQAICWKNQLFNYQMAASYIPDTKELAPLFPIMDKAPGPEESQASGTAANNAGKRKSVILPFKNR
jgi:hypothetical protein